MKKIFGVIFCIFLAVQLTGCVLTRSRNHVYYTGGLSLPYSGPKAKITVVDLETKTARAGKEVTSALRAMLIKSLSKSSRFLIEERKGSAGGDLIVLVVVEELQPQSSGGSNGIGGGGGVSSGILGGLLGPVNNKAHIIFNIRIIDAITAKVLRNDRLQAQASDAVVEGAGGSDFSGALSEYAGTPMEKAIRICINETVRYIAQATPENYYKYK